MKTLCVLLLGVLIALNMGCDRPKGAQGVYSYSALPTYTEIDNNIFKGKCLRCHFSGDPNLSSYDTLMSGSSVTPYQPNSSPLYQQILFGMMPKGEAALSETDIFAVYSWILAGAKNDKVTNTPPEAPSSLAATSTSPTQVYLTWSLSSTNITQTKIERATNSGGPFSSIANIPTLATSYTDTGLTASTTYYYRVIVTNLYGTSPNSSVASVTTQTYPPSAPSSLAASAISQTQVNLTWTDNSSNETGFKVERSSTSSSSGYSVIATLGAGVVSYSDTTAVASTTYYYRVYAYHTSSSDYSNVVNVTTPANPSTVPTKPSALAATASSSSQINLTWTDNSNNESGFKIERSTSAGGPFTLIATASTNAVAYADTGLSASTTYYYRIYAYNVVGDSATPHPTANATTQATASSPPSAPSGLSLSVISASQINLTWTDNSSDESGFKIERSTSAGGPFTLIGTTVSNVTSYSSTGLSPLTTYYYRVSAYNAAGDSAQVAANATTTGVPPNVPTGLAASTASKTQINLAWTDASSDETGFKIERSTSSSGPFSLIATLGANTTSYSDTGLGVATQYFYRIYAYNGYGNSAYSTLADATTIASFTWINTNIIRLTPDDCYSCHKSPGPKGQYDMSNYTNVMTRVVPNDYLNSEMYQRVIDGSMPKAGSSLSPNQINAIKSWIQNGAPND